MDLLTVQESAQLLKLAPVTVRRHIASGRLPAVRVGRLVRLHREAVEAFASPFEPGDGSSSPQRERRPREEHSLLRPARLRQAEPVENGGEVEEFGPSILEGQPLTFDDPIWGIVGMFDSSPDGPGDVATNKDRYLAEAHANLHGE